MEDWSRDGRYAVLRVVNPKTLFDIWVLPLNQDKPGDGKPFPYLLTEFGEVYAKSIARWALVGVHFERIEAQRDLCAVLSHARQ